MLKNDFRLEKNNVDSTDRTQSELNIVIKIFEAKIGYLKPIWKDVNWLTEKSEITTTKTFLTH